MRKMNMSFGENLQFYRKKSNITQEQLAEKLDVSRQSISKWESNTTYPEMDKLLQMCEMFSCTLDTLLRGDAERSANEDTADYDRHMNGFSISITAGVGLLFLGVAVLLVLMGIGVSSSIAVMSLLVFVVAGIMIMISTGLGHDSYTKKHPAIRPFYTEATIDTSEKRFRIMITSSIGLMFLGIMWLVGSRSLPLPEGCTMKLYTGIFMLIFAVSVMGMVYSGMQKDKYDIEKYNKSNSPEAREKAKQQEENPLIGKWCGSFFMIAIAAYLVMGFVWQLWSTAWVVFPVAVFLCAIASLIINKDSKTK